MLQRRLGQLCDASRGHCRTLHGPAGTRQRDRDCMSEEDREREGTGESERASDCDRGRGML